MPVFGFMLSGFLIWTAHFMAVYGLTGLLCARPGWAAGSSGWSMIHLGIGLATVLALALLAVVFRLAWLGVAPGQAFEIYQAARFLRSVTLGSAALAAVAVIWQALPALTIPSCL